jgi:pimeloyl-ACP methyl ester carboxylesterase
MLYFMKNWILICLCLLSTVCGCHTEVAVGNRIDPIDVITKDELKQYWNYDELASQYIGADVSVYRIEYSSEIDGEIINLSGAVLVPNIEIIKGIIGIQHSTFFADEEAPSENGDFSVVSRKAIFASHGYVVTLPDYLGYGVDKERIHPYHQANTLALASYDIIAVAKALLDDIKVSVPDKLFIAGYSEGAYATAALQQYIDKYSNLNVSAISLGSGSYDLKSTFELLVDAKESSSSCLPCNAFFIQSYNSYYKIDKPLSYYFKDPYSAELEDGLLLGEYDAAAVAQRLTNNPQELFQEGFLNDFKGGIQEWEEILSQNSIHDWEITVPTLITHNTNDEVSPFFNSERLFELNRDNPNIIFEPVSGTNHFTGIFNWGIMTMNYFDSF